MDCFSYLQFKVFIVIKYKCCGLLGYDIMPSGKGIPIFQKVWGSASGLKCERQCSSKTLVITHQMTSVTTHKITIQIT